MSSDLRLPRQFATAQSSTLVGATGLSALHRSILLI
jgi:hypothetical protein